MKPYYGDDLKTYQTPELKKVGSVSELTQQKDDFSIEPVEDSPVG